MVIHTRCVVWIIGAGKSVPAQDCMCCAQSGTSPGWAFYCGPERRASGLVGVRGRFEVLFENQRSTTQMGGRAFLACAVLTFGLVFGGGCTSGDGETEEHPGSEEGHASLSQHMAHLQRLTHKTALAIEARNRELTDFYLHETEEQVETVRAEVPTYEGYRIAELTESMLVPSVEAVENAVDDGEWSMADDRLRELEAACNQCHAATDHEFVRITLQDLSNPFAQDFSADAP